MFTQAEHNNARFQKACSVDYRELRRFMRDGFIALGVPGSDAEICADILIESDLRGIKSHGIGRFKMYVDRIRAGVLNPVTTITILKETENTLVIDGNHGMGHVVGFRAMEQAILKAKTKNIGIAAVRNSSHFGIAGYYPTMAVKHNMAGFAFSNARPSVAPTFGVRPVIGTNPISFGAPSDEDNPFLLDIATSTTQRGKLEVYAREGRETPRGLTIAEDGHELTDSRKLLSMLIGGSASLLPLGGAGEELGGHKGYGLGVMIEILCAAFSGGSFGSALSGFEQGKEVPHRLGHFFIAINIESFIPLNLFRSITGSIMREIRASTRAPGKERIYLAGEKEFEMMERNKNEGVAIPETLQKTMITLHRELGLGSYDIDFL
ncbi:MAG TPA: Ldh family oxidoreductase [Deltaproteobacteria bacterium]|nr:Ldh family oxidoreductase [Deltaproteobacteria bacterium]